MIPLAASTGCLENGARTPEDESGMGAGSADGGSPWPPDDCSLEDSPFVQTECLASLQEECNAIEDERTCSTVPLAPFVNGGFEVTCKWAKVVSFSNVETCEVAEVRGRCEASLEQLACGDSCAGETLAGSASAIPSESELILLCGGPLGEWSAVGNTDAHVGGCGDNLLPPEPDICRCLEAACDG